jgi:Lrp/AsnC family leucine-responsive transcriptional regulator
MTPLTLDQIDRRMLALLQTDGRLSNAKLAMQMGLSQSACLRRAQRLERAGVIEGYGARISDAALGRAETVFIELTLDSQSEAAPATEAAGEPMRKPGRPTSSVRQSRTWNARSCSCY